MADLGGNLGEVFGNIGGAGGVFGFVKTSLIGIVAIGVLAMCGFFIYWIAYKRKSYNLKAEIKIPRSDGKLVTAEWGKANYNEKKGAIYIKRKGKKAVPMKIADPRVYIQGENIITVAQLSPGNYLPILPESFIEVVDDVTGEEALLTKIKTDLSASRAWKSSFEREAKQAYSITSLLKEYATFIGIGLILFMNFAGFAILYSKVA